MYVTNAKKRDQFAVVLIVHRWSELIARVKFFKPMTERSKAILRKFRVDIVTRV